MSQTQRSQRRRGRAEVSRCRRGWWAAALRAAGEIVTPVCTSTVRIRGVCAPRHHDFARCRPWPAPTSHAADRVACQRPQRPSDLPVGSVPVGRLLDPPSPRGSGRPPRCARRARPWRLGAQAPYGSGGVCAPRRHGLGWGPANGRHPPDPPQRDISARPLRLGDLCVQDKQPRVRRAPLKRGRRGRRPPWGTSCGQWNRSGSRHYRIAE